MRKVFAALTAATVISATVLAMADTANAQWGYRGFNRGIGYRGVGVGLGYRGLGGRGYGYGVRRGYAGYAGYGGGYAGYGGGYAGNGGYAGYGGGYGGYAGYAATAAATQAMVDTLATAVTQDTAVDTLATAVELAEPRLLSPWLLSPQSGVAAPEGFSRGSESYASGHRAALHCFTKPRSNWVSRNMRAFAA